jgi:threonine dehydratase
MLKSHGNGDPISGTGPVELRLQQVRRAQDLFKSLWPISRLCSAESLSRLVSKNVYLKLEVELPTGSFKPRGAVYALANNLSSGRREVVAFSTGNHGIAVSYAARLFNVAATIVLPRDANPVKREKILRLGARLIEHGKDSYEASLVARRYAEDNNAYLLDDVTDPDVTVGTGTIATEILKQVPAVDAVFVPIGDTALIRGIGGVMRLLAPAVKIIGVQPRNARTYYEAWKFRSPQNTRLRKTIADGLATPIAQLRNVLALLECVDDILLVSERELLCAVRHLLIEEHIVSEPAGAATTAAVQVLNSIDSQNIVLIVSGGNISEQRLRRALSNAH